jgi:predicted DNA-binding transcriptional regulator AlpA
VVRQVDVEDLVGAPEIADRLGIAQPETIHAWRCRYPDEFPQPIATVAGVLVWSWPDVEAWARKTGRLN